MHTSSGPRTPLAPPPHAPQPGGPMTAFASSSVSTYPARTASRYSRYDDGTQINRTDGWTFLPRSTAAAAAKSSTRPLAHEPMYACVILMPFTCSIGSVLLGTAFG